MSNPQKNYVQIGRVRSIKPEFFTHEGLFDLEIESHLPIRVAFSGLWTQCDREGRFRWQPRRLKTHILPYDECDFARVLDALATRGFVVRYEVDTVVYGWIPSFLVHQYINNREQESIIPPPDGPSIEKADIQRVLPGLEDATATRHSRVTHAHPTPLVQERGEGKGREGNINTTTLSSSSVSAQPANGVIGLVLRSGKTHNVTGQDLNKLREAYPAVDVIAELKKLALWLENNPNRRKKPAGIKRCIQHWMHNAETDARSKPRKSSTRESLVGNRPQMGDGSYKI